MDSLVGSVLPIILSVLSLLCEISAKIQAVYKELLLRIKSVESAQGPKKCRGN